MGLLFPGQEQDNPGRGLGACGEGKSPPRPRRQLGAGTHLPASELCPQLMP